jgi:hypothetical protein
MGNVSLVLPSIHPMIGINSLPAVNHQPEFAAHCITADADKALADGALAMAWTSIDLATDRQIRDRLINRQLRDTASRSQTDAGGPNTKQKGEGTMGRAARRHR